MITAATGIALQRNTPATTTDKLYNVGGDLYFDGSAVGGGSSYTAGTGLTLVGTEFNTSGTGHFDQITFTNDIVSIGLDTPTAGTNGIYIGKDAGKRYERSSCLFILDINAGDDNDGDENVGIGAYAGMGMGASDTQNTMVGYFAGKDSAGAC